MIYRVSALSFIEAYAVALYVHFKDFIIDYFIYYCHNMYCYVKNKSPHWGFYTFFYSETLFNK